MFWRELKLCLRRKRSSVVVLSYPGKSQEREEYCNEIICFFDKITIWSHWCSSFSLKINTRTFSHEILLHDMNQSVMMLTEIEELDKTMCYVGIQCLFLKLHVSIHYSLVKRQQSLMCPEFSPVSLHHCVYLNLQVHKAGLYYFNRWFGGLWLSIHFPTYISVL